CDGDKVKVETDGTVDDSEAITPSGAKVIFIQDGEKTAWRCDCDKPPNRDEKEVQEQCARKHRNEFPYWCLECVDNSEEMSREMKEVPSTMVAWNGTVG